MRSSLQIFSSPASSGFVWSLLTEEGGVYSKRYRATRREVAAIRVFRVAYSLFLGQSPPCRCAGCPSVIGLSNIPVLGTFRLFSGTRCHMVAQLNGLAKRSLIMTTRWLLQVCIVLAVGVGLVSCSKEQIDQFVTSPRQALAQPAQFIESASPCQPAGLTSNATPDFCVNVMEIQLSNHDSQADVSVTIVNRRGRRLFLVMPNSPSLTDSSGTRWSSGGFTGIPNYLSQSLPVDPNAEAQLSFLFRRSGQAPPDMTFSMRGEIAILKADSRGEPIPGQVAVTRGFNLSGIRIQDTTPFGSLLAPPPK